MAKREKETPAAEEAAPANALTSEIVPVSEPSTRPVEPPPSRPAGSTPGQGVRRFFALLFRLVLALVILGAIAAGLYFGLPLAYQKYVVPVQENTAQLEQLNEQLARHEATIAELQTQLQAIQTGQAQHAQSIADLNGRVQSMEEQVAVHTKSLAALEQMQTTLQAENEATTAEVTRQIKLMKSMELLSRARLFMYQSNFGLARQDVQTARDLLAEVQPAAPADLASNLTEVLRRLDLTLSNLPAFPVAASDDLDIAWQVLLSGVPQPAATETPSPTPVLEITSTPTLTPTLVPTATP